MAPEYGQFAFFEFAWFGLPLTLLAALLFGLFPRFLVPPAREDVAELKEIETPEGGIHMWIAGGIYFLVIICMATGLVPLTSAAMLGAMLCVITLSLIHISLEKNEKSPLRSMLSGTSFDKR